MRRAVIIVMGLVAVVVTSIGHAQQPVRPAAPAQPTPANNQLGPPHAWSSSYTEETPRDYIRRRAQEKADARRARIEGMKWLGYSPLRPTTTPMPFMGHAPTWSPSQFWVHPNVSFYWNPGMFAASP